MSDSGLMESARPDNPGDTRERTERGRFALGNTTSRLGGRPTRARELEVFEAAQRGAPAAEIEKLMAKMVQLGLEGDVSAARLVCQVRGLIGREDPPQAIEQGESYASVIAKPGNVERIDELMRLVFESDKPGERRPA